MILWICLTFLVGSFAGVLGKRYGLVYPTALVSALVVMANFFANKIVLFGPFSVPAGVIVFSMSFFITDLICERWSKKDAENAIWAGFFSSIVFVLSAYIVTNWQPAAYATDISGMFSQVLALTPRITIAGFIAYLISQHHDIWAFHLLKKKTRGKHLWLRNTLSTTSSQLIDSIIFITIAFYGVYPILPLIVGQWAVKVFIALIDTPFMYMAIWMMDKVPGKKTG
ncbi:MAG: queuosine precursor transporter [Candidatus Woesearchaeota archaeon]